MKKLLEKLIRPEVFQFINGLMFLLWFTAAPFIAIFWHDSIQFLVWVSVYAVVLSHLEAWATAYFARKAAKANPNQG